MEEGGAEGAGGLGELATWVSEKVKTGIILTHESRRVRGTI